MNLLQDHVEYTQDLFFSFQKNLLQLYKNFSVAFAKANVEAVWSNENWAGG